MRMPPKHKTTAASASTAQRRRQRQRASQSASTSASAARPLSPPRPRSTRPKPKTKPHASGTANTTIQPVIVPTARSMPATPTATTSALRPRRSSHLRRKDGSDSCQPSLVRDARQRRAEHAEASSFAATSVESLSEYEHLREELERVLLDHQRQADEIVALRSLARTLKEDAERLQCRIQTHQRPADEDDEFDTAPTASENGVRRHGGHEFFQLDIELDRVRDDNARVREALDKANGENATLRAIVERDLPRQEIETVKARAELESVRSQLHAERQQNDELRRELARYQARSRVPIVLPATKQSGANPLRRSTLCCNPVEDKNPENKENVQFQGPRRYLRNAYDEGDSSPASLARSASSAFSSQLQGDLETLNDELRRLHRTLDASVQPRRGSRVFGES